jgi:hypothetical protein
MLTLPVETVIRELTQLVDLATAVMHEHHDDHGLCVICGSAWPCERVVLADHNLAVTS